jgi:hypothetical protein
LKSFRPAALRLERLEPRTLPSVTVTRLSDNATFASIQAAINDAATVTGSTLQVSAGTDAEQVTVNKSVTLLGAQHGVDARNRSGAESIVTGTGNNGDTPFNITAKNVTLDGFTVEGGTSTTTFGFGIVEGAGTSGARILNDIIQDNIAGLSLANSTSGSAGLIQHNLFRNNNASGPVSGTAIYTDQFNAGGSLANVTIDANTFSDNKNACVIVGPTDATKGATNLTISNNTFDTNGNAVLLFNTSSSMITTNTMTNSTASQLVLGGGVNGLTVTRNLILNGAARGIQIGDFGGGGTNQNVTIDLNSIQGNSAAGLEIGSATASYTGALNAACNWWGDLSGPTITSNAGGKGQTLTDPNGHVAYRTWLIYGTDADTTAAGFQLPATVSVTAGGDVSAADNDYTRLANAIGCAQNGQTITLSGTFDWTKPLAAAAWAKGNDGAAGTADDYTITAPANVSGVTVTAASLGSATVQGPGSLTNSGTPTLSPGFLAFNGGPDQNWTLSNLQVFDFNTAVNFVGGAGPQTLFKGTTITNNHIRVPAPLNQTLAPQANPTNVGIHYSFGANQTISNNQIDLNGGAASDTAGGHPATEIGILSNTGGGNSYDGLRVTGNTVNVLHAQASDPEHVFGIWENGGTNSASVTVSGNHFVNLAAGNSPAANAQVAFQLTSASGATATVLYQNNQVAGAHVGFRYFPTYDNTGTQPVRLVGNTLTNVFNAFDFANGARTVNYLSGNTATGTGGAGTGIAVGSGVVLTTDGASGTNSLSGFATGVDVAGGTATLRQNTLTGDGTGVHVGSGGQLTTAANNFIRNNTGAGVSVAAGAGTVGAITNNDLSGNAVAVANASAALLDASANWWGGNTRAAVQAAITGAVDYTPFLDNGTDTAPGTPGFQGDFSTLDVDAQSPQSGAVGRIQEGVNDATSNGTVNVLAGTYAENVSITKNLTLAGAAGTTPTSIIHPAANDGVTIGAPATSVTVRDLEITGAANGIAASGLTTLALQNLLLTGNTTAGGTVNNVGTINYTPQTGSTGAASTITGASFRRGSAQAVNYSGVPILNVFGSDGSDTFDVTPAGATTITVQGGLPTPQGPAPGDTLTVELAGTTARNLSDTFDPAAGFFGSWTFGNAAPVNFAGIESLNSAPPANISGTVFFDYNGNGVLDAGETGLGGRTVFLDLNNNGTLDAAEPTAVTDGNGNYVFSAVTASAPTVRMDLVFANVIVTGPAGGAYHITLTGAAATGLNFGAFQSNAVAPVVVAADRFGGTNPDADTAYVRGLYFTLLGRDANLQLRRPDGTTISEVQYWLDQLHGGSTRQQVAQGIAASDEHRGLEVDSYYRTFLRRGETAAEREYWVGKFAAGDDERTVVEGFLNSPEYQGAHAGDDSYVRDLYFSVLGRFGSDAEVAEAEADLAGGMTRQALADRFVRSDEANQLAVTAFYGAYLHRAPDAGLSVWTGALKAGATTEAVQAGILGDPTFAEFYHDGAATVR